MKRTATWLLTALTATVLMAVLLLTHTSYFRPLRLDWFYTRVFATFALDSPELLSSLRILPPWLDFYSARLDDASPAQARKAMARLRNDLEVLDQYDRADLDRDGKLSYDTLQYYMSMQLDGEPFLPHAFPVNQLDGVQTALPEFMVQVHRIASVGEAESYIARLRKFPLKFGQVQQQLRLSESKGVLPPRFTVEKVLQQMNAFISAPPQQHRLYMNMRDKLAALPAGQADQATRSKLLADTEAAIRDQVYPAYRGLIAHFTALQPKALKNEGAWSLPNGDEYYAWAVRMHTTTDFTPRQVHSLGLAEVARVGAEMDAILKGQGLAEGSIGARVQALAAQPDQKFPDTDEGRKAMLAQYRAIIDEAGKGMGAAFDLHPKLGLKVEAVPAASQASAPSAYYQPGAFDGSRPSVFFVNMRAPGETPKFAMRTQAHHEGLPGHHLQIAVAMEMEDVPFFRKVIPFSAYQEGWALYAERLASEMGWERTPLDKLGRLRDDMMRATRLVVDSGIHYKRWTREQAIAYMLENTGMPEADVTAEVERYFVAPGQALAYKIGMLTILSLREHARAELGDKFDLKAFHKEVLTHGALPLKVLEHVVSDWVALQKRT
ncbi:DUF885 domain-containing protein [Pseudoduganella sp. LjRoot289]|uniref:DUF885 domain-containing protein n=1 Tax=Pseudoduganella sp. LjRoot289 TaxID=3342314 RepID=UPI003ED03162